MRKLSWILLPAIVVPLAFLVRERLSTSEPKQPTESFGTDATHEPKAAVPLAAEHYAYREHGDGRIVSEVEIELTARENEKTELRLHASSIGPLVEPPRGWTWIRGENPITAREMLQIVESERARIVTRNVDTNEEISGEARLGVLGHFIERVLQPDGTIADIGKTNEPLPQSVGFTSGELGAGTYVTELFVDDHSRLRVEFDFDGTSGRISNIESGHPEDDKVGAP